MSRKKNCQANVDLSMISINECSERHRMNVMNECHLSVNDCRRWWMYDVNKEDQARNHAEQHMSTSIRRVINID